MLLVSSTCISLLFWLLLISDSLSHSVTVVIRRRRRSRTPVDRETAIELGPVQRNTDINADETQKLVEPPPTELAENADETDETESSVEAPPAVSTASIDNAENSAELSPPVGKSGVSPASQQDLTCVFSVSEKGTDSVDKAGETTQVRARSLKEHSYALAGT